MLDPTYANYSNVPASAPTMPTEEAVDETVYYWDEETQMYYYWDEDFQAYVGWLEEYVAEDESAQGLSETMGASEMTATSGAVTTVELTRVASHRLMAPSLLSPRGAARLAGNLPEDAPTVLLSPREGRQAPQIESVQNVTPAELERIRGDLPSMASVAPSQAQTAIHQAQRVPAVAPMSSLKFPEFNGQQQNQAVPAESQSEWSAPANSAPPLTNNAQYPGLVPLNSPQAPMTSLWSQHHGYYANQYHSDALSIPAVPQGATPQNFSPLPPTSPIGLDDQMALYFRNQAQEENVGSEQTISSGYPTRFEPGQALRVPALAPSHITTGSHGGYWANTSAQQTDWTGGNTHLQGVQPQQQSFSPALGGDGSAYEPTQQGQTHPMSHLGQLPLRQPKPQVPLSSNQPVHQPDHGPRQGAENHLPSPERAASPYHVPPAPAHSAAPGGPAVRAATLSRQNLEQMADELVPEQASQNETMNQDKQAILRDLESEAKRAGGRHNTVRRMTRKLTLTAKGQSMADQLALLAKARQGATHVPTEDIVEEKKRRQVQQRAREQAGIVGPGTSSSSSSSPSPREKRHENDPSLQQRAAAKATAKPSRNEARRSTARFGTAHFNDPSTAQGLEALLSRRVR